MNQINDSKRKIDWLTVLQFGFSTFAVFVLWTSAAGLLVTALTGMLTGSDSKTGGLFLFVIAVSLFSMGALAVPSVFFSFMRILGKKDKARTGSRNWLFPILVAFFYFAVVLLGYFLAQETLPLSLLLGPLQVLAMGLPVLFFIYLGVRGLPLGSLQRVWGAFGSGLLLSPLLIMILEAATLLFLLMLLVMFTPSVMKDLSGLLDQGISSPPSQSAIVEGFAPLLTNPWVIGGVFLFVSVSIPLIEELFKPVAVWLLAGRKISAPAGFAAGLISGAGYALVENLMLFSGTQGWHIVVLMRAGTVAVHTFTAGMVGWAIIQMWRKHRYWLLIGVYVGAVVLHGSWNGLTIILSGIELSREFGVVLTGSTWLEWTAEAGLLLLVLVAVAGLLLMNNKLRREIDGESDRINTSLSRI